MNNSAQRRRGRLLGLGLLVLLVGLVTILNCVFPGSHPIGKGAAVVLGGVCFLLMSSLLLASYFIPERSAVFRALEAIWENAPGTTYGRLGLLLLGGIFALCGIWLVIAGSGIFA